MVTAGDKRELCGRLWRRVKQEMKRLNYYRTNCILYLGQLSSRRLVVLYLLHVQGVLSEDEKELLSY